MGLNACSSLQAGWGAEVMLVSGVWCSVYQSGWSEIVRWGGITQGLRNLLFLEGSVSSRVLLIHPRSLSCFSAEVVELMRVAWRVTCCVISRNDVALIVPHIMCRNDTYLTA